MAGRAAIFIDGAYLERILRVEYDRASIDFSELSRRMAGDLDLLRTYYYHCLPYQSTPPSEYESQRYAARRRFFYFLESLPRFEVRLGQLEFRGYDESGRPRFEQKRVDILLGVDMVQLTAKRIVQEVILLAGDSDFIPAIVAAKSEGATIRLFHGRNPHSDLRREADERTQITQDFIDSILRP